MKLGIRRYDGILMGLFVRRTYEAASFVTARRVDGVEGRVDGVEGHAVAATQRRRDGVRWTLSS